MLILEMWEAGSRGEYNQDTLYTLLDFQRINIFLKKEELGIKKSSDLKQLFQVIVKI